MKKTASEPQAEAVSKSANSFGAEFSSVAILTKKEAAQYLRTSTRFIERMVRSGRLRACKPTNGIFRVRRSDLDEFLDDGSTISK